MNRIVKRIVIVTGGGISMITRITVKKEKVSENNLL